MEKFDPKIYFFAIMVSRIIWSMPAKIFWGGPLVWEEIEKGQTVHKSLAKLLYRCKHTVGELFGGNVWGNVWGTVWGTVWGSVWQLFG
jgi:hypothetical protein